MTRNSLTHIAAVALGIAVGAGVLAFLGHQPPAAFIPAPNPTLAPLDAKLTSVQTSHDELPVTIARAASVPFNTISNEPLKGYDIDGRLIRVGEEPTCRAVVLAFLGTDCPIARSSIPKLNRIAQEFSSEGVEVYGVYSDPFLTRDALKAHIEDFSVQFPVLFDAIRDLAGRFENRTIPQTFILTSEAEVIYSGAIDEQFVALTKRNSSVGREHLRLALRELLSGNSITVRRTEPIGCRVTDQERQAPSFNRDIAPIVYGNCSNCHHEGAVAPFSLTTLHEIRKHSAQIRVMVDLDLMPPWKPTPGFGHFADEQRLTQREREVLLQWLDNQHLPIGNPEDRCPVPTFLSDWSLGEPDIVLQVPEMVVPADGPDIYQYSVLPLPLGEDRLVSAVEFRSTNPRVIHHASFRYDDKGNARRLDAECPGPGYRRFGGWGFWTGGTLGGWALGVLPTRLPEGFGRPLKANSDFVIQTHYHPSGKKEVEESKVAIYLTPHESKCRISEIFVANIDLRIPSGERRFVHRASYTLPVDTRVHSVLPHTHLLGKSTTAIAVLPDETVMPLIRIEDWDFNWQGQYFYRRPLLLPKGTRIDFEVVFDNSSFNPLNPNSPPAIVGWGEETTHEMAVCFFDVSTEDHADLDRLTQHNRRYIARQEFELTGQVSGAFGTSEDLQDE